MQRTSIRALAALVLVITVSILAPATVVSPAYAEGEALANPFTQYALPGNPKNVFVESPARIWFTLPDSNQIVLFQPPAQAEVSDAAVNAATPFPTGAGTKPYDLVMLNGLVYFTALGTNQIGRLNPGNGQVTLFNIPTANSEPTGITAGGGFIWFVERKGDKLGRLNPANGAIAEFTDKNPSDGNLVDMSGAQLEDVAYSSFGPWFTGPKFKTSVAVYVVSQAKFVGSPAGEGVEPMGIAVDSLDVVWITDSAANQIGRSSLNTLGLWDFFPLPAAPTVEASAANATGPVGISIRQANGLREIWYTRPGINRVGRQLTKFDGTRMGVFENVSPVANGAPWGIGVDATGKVWVATSGAAKALRWTSPYFAAFDYLPMIRRQQ